ncbi:MAG: hypothetical protein KDK45_25495 [Leptospiraceae bacterium]|nr:hypothetical protein [Leptospiraceae bacterium]
MKLLRDYDRLSNKSDLDIVNMLYSFLTGDDEVEKAELEYDIKRHKKLSKADAFKVIWFLQEVIPVFPDSIEQCCYCKELYDSNNSGVHIENTGRNYCDGCRPD